MSALGSDLQRPSPGEPTHLRRLEELLAIGQIDEDFF